MRINCLGSNVARAAVLVVLVGVLAVTYRLDAGTLYSQNFTSNPGFTSLAPSYAYWDNAAGNYYVRTRDDLGASYWAYSPSFGPVTTGSDITVAFDVLFESQNWGTYPGVRFFNSQPTSISTPCVFMVNNSYWDGRTEGLAFSDCGPNYYETPHYSIDDGVWYRVTMVLHTATNRADLSVARRSDSVIVGSFTNVAFVAAPFSWLGVGYYNEPDYGSDWSPIRLDNVVISTTGDNADLALTSLSVTRPGDSTSRTFTGCSFNVVNNGPTALSSEFILVDYYLSDDTSFGDADDRKIGDTGFTVSIASGATYPITLSPTGLGYMSDEWVQGLVPNGNYYVFAKVRLTDGSPTDPAPSNDFSRTGSTFAYNEPCPAPGSFSLTSPAHQSTSPAGTTSVNLQWGASSSATSYDVYFGTASNPPLVGNQTQTSRSVTVANGQTYYWKVIAKNSCGSTPSSSGTRTFAVDSQQQTNRVVRVVESSGSPGGSASVPVEFVAQGDENALGFSVTFDPAVLSNPVAALGTGAAGASLNTNTTQTATGKLGVALALPAGQTFAAGTRQLLAVTFNVTAGTITTSTPVGFGDQPIAREVASATATALTATWTGGTVTITQGYEADVAPRPNGNGTVSTTDWVQVGRFAAGLDTAAAGSEFQRADCAPRSSLGNGAISTTDWVQAGRYAAGLDPQTAAGGPTTVASSVAPGLAVHTFGTGAPITDGNPRRVALRTLDLGDEVEVTITLDATGEENALGLSLAFDPQAAGLVGVLPGRDAGGALVDVNVADALAGRIGIALALPAGRAIHGTGAELVVLRFTRASFDMTSPLRVTLVEDGPVAAELGSVDAEPLPLAIDTGLEPDRAVRRRMGSSQPQQGVQP